MYVVDYMYCFYLNDYTITQIVNVKCMLCSALINSHKGAKRVKCPMHVVYFMPIAQFSAPRYKLQSYEVSEKIGVRTLNVLLAVEQTV